MYLPLGISLSCLFVTVSGLFCFDFFENFVILLAILVPVKAAVDFAVVWITLFEVVLSVSVVDYLGWSIPLKFLLIFLPIFLPTFLAEDKRSILFYKYLMSWLNWIVHHFLYFTTWLITKVIFILSSISSGLEFWSVNHNSIYKNSESKFF